MPTYKIRVLGNGKPITKAASRIEFIDSIEVVRDRSSKMPLVAVTIARQLRLLVAKVLS